MTSTTAYLERIDRTRNLARYYRLSVVETLFGDWALVREWGRIGRNGQSRNEWFVDADEARRALEAFARGKQKRGYRDC